jgi:hypothetical protein
MCHYVRRSRRRMADLERELEKRRKAEALLLADWRMITSEPRRVQPRRFQETAKRLVPFRGPPGLWAMASPRRRFAPCCVSKITPDGGAREN